MGERIFTGWLFDIYPSPDGIMIWLIDQNGVKQCVNMPFVPSFFMHVAVEEE